MSTGFIKPDINDVNRGFWAGADDGVLSVQRCDSCGELRYPPALRCPGCLSAEWSWQPLSGRGEILSYIVIHQKYKPQVVTSEHEQESLLTICNAESLNEDKNQRIPDVRNRSVTEFSPAKSQNPRVKTRSAATFAIFQKSHSHYLPLIFSRYRLNFRSC